MELPASPATWGGVDGNDTSPTRLSENGRVGVTPLIVALKSGRISNGWCIAEGEPPGPYRITVSQDGKPLARFDFTIEGEEGEDTAKEEGAI